MIVDTGITGINLYDTFNDGILHISVTKKRLSFMLDLTVCGYIDIDKGTEHWNDCKPLLKRKFRRGLAKSLVSELDYSFHEIYFQPEQIVQIANNVSVDDKSNRGVINKLLKSQDRGSEQPSYIPNITHRAIKNIQRGKYKKLTGIEYVLAVREEMAKIELKGSIEANK